MPGPGKKPSRKALVEEFLREHNPAEVTPAVLAAARRYVITKLEGVRISDRYLVELAEAAGFAVAREAGGLPIDLRDRVHFHDFDAAETSLRDMQREYLAALETSDRLRMQDFRRAVLRAKERLGSLLRHPGLTAAKHAEKEEIASWFRVWLETPDLFADWIALRRQVLAREPENR